MAGDVANMLLFITRAYMGQDNRLLSKQLASDMLSLQGPSRFGLGVVLGGVAQSFNFRKNGYNSGYHSQLIMFPNVGKGIVVMTNHADGMPIIKAVMAKAAQHYEWPSFSMNFNELEF